MSAVFKFENWQASEPAPPTAAALNKALIQLEGVTKTYDTGENAVQALRGVDAAIGAVTPEQALDCFLRTQMDVIVINDLVIKRNTVTQPGDTIGD